MLDWIPEVPLWLRWAAAVVTLLGTGASGVWWLFNRYGAPEKLAIRVREQAYPIWTDAPDFDDPLIVIEVSNSLEEAAVMVRDISLELPDGLRIPVAFPPGRGILKYGTLPAEVEPQKFDSFHIDRARLVSALRDMDFTSPVQLVTVVTDGIDNEYTKEFLLEFEQGSHE